MRDRPYPLTRASALRRWKAAIISIAAAQGAVLLVVTAIHRYAGRAGTDTMPFSGRLELLLHALGIPLLFLGIAYFAERRLLRRPPKPLLLYQFGLFTLGTALETACVLVPDHVANLMNGIGRAALGLAVLAVGGWFVGVLLSPVSNEF
ncbi:MAG: hypothetical protein ABIT01_06625 [Thermoanaerobaculia bacterium]